MNIKLARGIWILIIVVTGMFFGALLTLDMMQELPLVPMDKETLTIIEIVFIFLTVADTILMFALYNYMKKPEILKRYCKRGPSHGSDSDTKEEYDRDALLSYYLRLCLLQGGLAYSVVIYGTLYGVFAGLKPLTYVFFAIATVLIITINPSDSNFNKFLPSDIRRALRGQGL